MSDRTWSYLARTVVILGLVVLAMAGVGYGLGWNDGHGLRHHSNIVPLCLFGGIAILFSGGAMLLARSPEPLTERRSSTLPIAILAFLAWSSVAVYVLQLWPLIAVRADVVMGSESQFVDHIIRYRAGQPQYTPGGDANTSAYTPGAPLLTYFLACALGRSTSIPVYRLIQQLYLLLAVIFATLSARELFRLCRPKSELAKLWLLFWIPFLYLISNNPRTNLYTHVLYSDGLALAVNAIAFWLMVKHFTTSDDRWLIAMAALPSLGFLAKQKEAIWAGLYIVYLFLSRRTSLRQIAVFGVAAFALLGITVGLCRAIWSAPFDFWTFEVLSRLHVWLHKALEQFANAGWYILLGFAGGLLLLREGRFRLLFPLWFCWVLECLAAIYTSGVAFFPAHLGPATLVGAVWFLVGLSTVWPEERETADPATYWWRTIAVPAMILLFFVSGGILHTGSSVPPQLEQYLSAIEREFNGLPPDRVLLDTGSWVYLPQNTVMRDRDSPLGTLWGAGASDFKDTTTRLRQHYYRKILLRKVGPGYLFRDRRINDALQENYREIRVIPSPGAPEDWLYRPALFAVGVLEPVDSPESDRHKETANKQYSTSATP